MWLRQVRSLLMPFVAYLADRPLWEMISCETFWTLCQQALAESPAAFTSNTWIIDGIDELEQQDQELLIGVIEDFEKLLPKYRVLLLSGDEHCIRRRLSSLKPLEIRVTEASNREDMHRYIVHRVQNWGALGSTSLTQEVINALDAKASGIFLWVKLIVDELEHLHDRTEIRPAIARLPGNMKSLYNAIFENLSTRLKPTERALSLSIINWTALARKSLNLSELASALSLQGTYTAESLRESIPAVCGSLIVMEEFGDRVTSVTIRLLHASLAEYLNAKDEQCNYALNAGEVHAAIARSCFAQLRDVSQCPLFYPVGDSTPYKLSNYHTGNTISGWSCTAGPDVIDPDSIADESCTSFTIFPYIEKCYPLFSYAWENCAYHIGQSADDIEAGELTANDFQDFIFNAAPAALIWLAKLDYKEDRRKHIIEQLLRFCQKMGDSPSLGVRIVHDVAMQMAGDNIDGWLFRLGKMRINYAAFKPLELGNSDASMRDQVQSDTSQQLGKMAPNINDEDLLSALQSCLDLCGIKLPDDQSVNDLLDCTEDKEKPILAFVARFVHEHQNRCLLTAFGHALKMSGHMQRLARFLSCMDRTPLTNVKMLEVKAQMLFSAEEYNEAAKVYLHISKTESTRWDLKETIISALCLDGQTERASQELASYHASFPKDPENWCPHAWIEERRARLSFKSKIFQQHRVICTNGIAKYPDWWAFWHQKRKALAKLRDNNAVVRCLQAAQQRPKLELVASKELNKHLLENRQYADAITESCSAIQRFPKNYKANELLWKCWEQSPEAIRMKILERLRDLTKLADPYWISFIYYAKACIELGYYQEAVEACLSSIAMNGSNIPPFYFAAKAYEALGEPQAALDLLCSAPLLQYPYLGKICVHIASLTRQLERWEDLGTALSFKKISERDVCYGEELAFAHLKRKRYFECQEVCQEMLARLVGANQSNSDSKDAESSEDKEAVENEQRLRLECIMGLALGCQNQIHTARELLVPCTAGYPYLWYQIGKQFLEESQLSLASFCFDAGLQDYLGPQQDTENKDVSMLEHTTWECEGCEESDFVRVGYICTKCRNFAICESCLGVFLKHHDRGHRWIKCPSSAYPRLENSLEKGKKIRERALPEAEDFATVDILGTAENG